MKADITSTSKRFASWVGWYVRSLTIEPMHLFWVLAIGITSGAQLTTNLQLDKVCRYELNYNDTICDDLGAYEDEQVEVQLVVNDLQKVGSWLATAPGIAYSFVAGPISDHVGLKPLLILPLTGAVIGSAMEIINYIYIETLPLEFFYMLSFFDYMGGYSVYYLGYYSYGSAITDQEGRASRLARFDGFEELGLFIGLLISPYVFDWLDYTGTYGLAGGLRATALLYVIFVVKEPPRQKPERKFTSKKSTKSVDDNNDSSSSTSSPAEASALTCGQKTKNFFLDNLVEPLYKFVEVSVRRRPRNLRLLLWVQIVVYGCYWFLVNETAPMYLWQTITFEDFDGTSSSHFQAYDRLIAMVGLFVVIPFLTQRLHLHDALILVFIQFLYCAGNAVMAFSDELWQLYLGQTLLFMRMSQWSTARALFTKCIPEEDIGSVYSVIAMLAATVPLASNPAFRELYDATIETFPSAFLLLGSALGLFTATGNFFLYTQRKKMLVNRWGEQINEGTGGKEKRSSTEDDDDDVHKEKQDERA